MLNPVIALLGAGLLLTVILLLLWPQIGIVWQLRNRRHSSKRVLIEDALKHIFHQDYMNQASTVHSIAGALGTDADHSAKLLAELESLGLVSSYENSLRLTAKGRADALRVVRAHRLWERYFADETGLTETEWHQQAERREHETTPEEAEALAMQMGNPLLDPHGDPIPTPSGSLPPPKGKPLTDVPAGTSARIIHLEDEPEVIYAQLVANGLYPGMRVSIIDKSPERIHFIANGEKIKLAPVMAANITVVPQPKAEKIERPNDTLSSLHVGEAGVVVAISNACRGMQRRRLMDLGIVPGTMISAELRSASGNPTAYNIRGALIALRKDQANLVQIRRVDKLRKSVDEPGFGELSRAVESVDEPAPLRFHTSFAKRGGVESVDEPVESREAVS